MIIGLFKKKKEEFKKDRGIIIFQEASEAIRAEKILKEKGFDVKVVAPPPSFRKGCDLAVEFSLMEQLAVERALKEKRCEFIEILPVSDELLYPLDICQIKDFGRYRMIKAANMKLTYEKDTLRIVNISGGGCPDVPYVSWKMIGKKLSEAPSPKDIGYSVCAYALWKALEEAKKDADNLRNSSF